MRCTLLTSAIALLSITSIGHASNRADIVTYSDHKPGDMFCAPGGGGGCGQPFVAPLSSCDRPSYATTCGTKPRTSIDFETVDDLGHPLGSSGWGLATFGKYVLMGNYEEGHQGTGIKGPPVSLTGEHVGVFDSEEKTFCVLDIDPTAAHAGVEWLQTATPEFRQSRIYFQGFLSASGDTGASFGYIEADLDNEHPCDATTGWRVVGRTPSQINAAAAPLPEKVPCPGSFCGFDGMELLHHDEATGTDTIVLNNWWAQRIVVADVDSTGNMIVRDVNLTDYPWSPAEADGACMDLLPVIEPVVNPIAPANDLRFAVGYDPVCGTPSSVYLCPASGTTCLPGGSCASPACAVGYEDCASNADCVDAYGDNGPCTNACLAFHPGMRCSATGTHCAKSANCPTGETCSPEIECAPQVHLCPDTGLACDPGSTCTQPVCALNYLNCGTNADCDNDAGPCTNACLSIHPGMRCSEAGTHCVKNQNCPAGENCVCGSGRPIQEFSFDGTTIAASSARFQTSAYKSDLGLGVYDQAGGLWIAEDPRDRLKDPLDEGSYVATYPQISGGHAYDNATNPTGTEIHAPGARFPFDKPDWMGRASHSVQVGAAMYTVGKQSIQRALNVSGAWSRDTTYRAFVGSDVLPIDAGTCSASNAPCRENADCLGGFCLLDQVDTLVEPWKDDIVLGGAPRSLWVTPRYTDPSRSKGMNTWLVRVPVPASLPDGISNVRPGVVWAQDDTCPGTCNRLWLVAEHDGQLKFRVRADGIWSSWYPLPAANPARVGGASAIFYGGTVELFSRSTAGAVITTKLTSPLGCSPSACTWSSWTTIPMGYPPLTTDAEPAAAVQNFGPNQGPFVAVRRTSDGHIFYARRVAGSWSTWHSAGTKVEPLNAPAVVSNPRDQTGRMWIVATRPSDGEIYWGRIPDGLSFGVWTMGPPRPGTVTAWGPAPQAISDPGRCSIATHTLCETDADCPSGQTCAGARIRVFAAQAASPQVTWQVTHDGQGWDSWGTIYSGGASSRQPVATLAAGDLNVFTYTATDGVQEQLVR